MLHVEMSSQAVLQMVENPADLAAGDALVGHHNVSSEYGQRRRQRPRVQIVHGSDLVEFEQVTSHFFEINILGGGLQKNA